MNIATREAYGQALVKLGAKYPEMVVLDGDTKNSTYAEKFKEKYPERYFEGFIAEQNMLGMSVGMSKMGKIPFASTFAAFWTRAYDQIRMAAVSKANIKIVGSHAGVSIGPDGASQMALEDLAMMRAVFGSTVLYPSDAVSAEKLVENMFSLKGISYLRTTREKTPIIYKEDEEFPIGRFKTFKSKDSKTQRFKTSSKSKAQKRQITIISAGITLHEALKAQEELKGKVGITVIDLYTIKPINREALQKAVQTEWVITVEDHYLEGGLGDAVLDVFSESPVKIKKMAVAKMPHSGTPEENLKSAGIDSEGIVKAILETV